MADVQLTASIDAAGFNRGINEMKHSLKDLQDTGNMTYDRLDSGFRSVENRLTSTGASVRRLETAFSRYATAMSQDLQMVAGASTQVGQKVDAASQKMAQDMRNLVQAVNQLQSAFTTLFQPIRNIDSQSAQTVTQLRNIVNEMRTLNSAVQQTNAQLQSMTSSTSSNTQANNANAASFDKQQSSIHSVKDIMQAVLALGFGSQFAKEVAEATGYMVQLEASFRVLLGSATEARNMMGDLVNFAMKTPFDLKGTADAAKQLLAYGIAAEDVIETERRLGDIGAALGLTMRDLAYLYGTTKTQGRLYALDMRQFTTRGIPMLETLSKQLNVTTADITKMVTAGQIGFKEVKDAIWAMTDEGGQFGGLMEEQFNTIKGQLSNLGDAWYQFLAALGKSADVEFGITDNLEDFNDKLMQLSSNADIIITTLKNLGTALALMGAVQGVAWLVKIISSMLAFGTVLGSTQVQMAGFSMQTATGTTIAGNFRAAWINAGRALANFRTIAATTGSTMAALSTSARLLGTAIGATMPYIGMAMAIYGVVQAIRAWNTEVDNSEQASVALAQAASSSDLAISKMYTKLQATSEGTKEHTAAIDKLIGKLVENNIVSQEYCDSLTTETAKTQLLIDKKNELARIERNKEVRSAGDTQRETIISKRTETFAEDAEEELKTRIGSYMTNRADDHTALGYDIEQLIDKDRIEQYVQMYGSTMVTAYNEIALAQADFNAKLITEAEYNDKVNTSREGAARAITALANNYAKGAEQAEKLRQRTQDLFDVQTGFQSNGSLFSKDLVNSFKAYVQELVDVETVVNQLTGTHSNPAQEYTSLSRDFSWLQHMTSEGTDLNNMVDVNGNAVSAMSALASVEELMSKLDEITSDPKMIQIDIEKGALNSLEQFVDHGKDQIQALVDYAREHPTEFTANIDEIEANMNSIVQKMEADPDHWKEHTTQFTGELTALNNALNSGADDIERFKKNHGKIDIDFGVILRNNSLKLVESMLEKLKKAFEALGLDDAVKRIDAALTSVRQRVAAVEEKRVKAGTTPGDRLAATRASYKARGKSPDLNTYNDYTTQELESRVKDIKSSLKKLKDDAVGNKAKKDLNEELDAINAELTQRSPSKSKSAADKKRKAAEAARREEERKKREEERRQKAAEALDKLMRKHQLALDEASDENLLNEYQRRLEELENQLNKKNNSIQDDLVSAENKAKESGRKKNKVMYGDEERQSYLTQDEINVFYNESTEAEKKYNKAVKDLNEEFLSDRWEYFEKYGSLMQQKLALVEDYNAKIRKAEEEGRTWDAKSLIIERDEKVQDLDMNRQRERATTALAYANMGALGLQLLQPMLRELKAYTTSAQFRQETPENQKILLDAVAELQSKVGGTMDFTEFVNSARELQAAMKDLQVADEAARSAFTTMLAKTAERNLAKSAFDAAIAAQNAAGGEGKNEESDNNVALAKEALRVAEEALKIAENDAAKKGKEYQDKTKNTNNLRAKTASNYNEAAAEPITEFGLYLGAINGQLGEAYNEIFNVISSLKQLKALKELAENVNEVSEAAENVTDAADAAGNLANSAQGVGEAVEGVKKVGEAAEDVSEAVEEGADAMSNATDALVEGLGKSGLIAGIIASIIKILDIFKDGLGPFLKSILDSVFSAIQGIIENIWNGQLFVQLGESIFNGISSIIKGIAGFQFWGSDFYEDFTESQKEARDRSAMEQMTAALLENTKALNNWLGEQGFAKFVQDLDIAAAKYKAFYARSNGEEIEYRDKNAGAIEWLTGHHRYTTTARENLKIQTQHASYWRGENTENLEQWVRDKMGKELFTEDGRLDLAVYEAMKQQSWYGDIKDYSKQTLEDLAKLEEEYKKIFDELKEYYSDLYSPLGDSLIDAVWDWYDNGVDALDSFHDKASDTFRKIANELMYEILQTNVFSKYREQIGNAITAYTTGGGNDKQRQEQFRNTLMQIAASLGIDLQNTIPALQETIELLDKELGKYGFSFNSANAQTATSGAFEGMTSDQADALEGRFTAVQGYTARITEILEDWYKNGVIYRGGYTTEVSPEQAAYSPVVNPTISEVNVDFTVLQQELKDVKEVMEKTNTNIIAFNTSFNTAHVDTADTLNTIVGRTATLPRQEELLRRMSKDIAEI